MKKWLTYGLLFTFLFSISILTTGCFGGLDDAEETSVTYLNNFFAQSDTPSAEKRYQKIVSSVSANFNDSPADPEDKEDVIKFISKFAVSGINKPYFIANAPNEPQTETRRYILVRFSKNSFADAKELFDEDESTGDAYQILALNKENDEWKIFDMDNVDEEAIKQSKIEWKEVEPTDYLD